MFNLSLIVGFSAFCLVACSQPERTSNPAQLSGSLKADLLKIQKIPSRYTDSRPLGYPSKSTAGDSVYNSLLKLDTGLIESLTDLLPDTSVTRILNPCGRSNFTVGQLAFLLVDDIEAVPLGLVTKMQFDVLDCGVVPDGVLDYVQKRGPEFQGQYRNYYHSKERQEILHRFIRNRE